MEELQKLLGEELFKQFKEKIGNTKVMIDDGNFIPKSRFDEVNSSKKELQTQVDNLKEISTKYEQLQQDVSKWKDQADQVPALKKKMEEWETSAKDLEAKLGEANTQITSFSEKEQQYQQQLKDTQITSTIEKELLKNSAKYPELIISKIDKTKVEIDENGVVKGVEEQLKALKESYKDLFGETKITGGNPGSGGNPNPAEDDDDMNDAEWLKVNEKRITGQ